MQKQFRSSLIVKVLSKTRYYNCYNIYKILKRGERSLSRSVRNIIRITIIIGIVVLTAVTLWFNFSSKNQSTKVGDTAVDFKLKTTEGEVIHLYELTKEKGVIINFWGTWCKPCREEMPHLSEANDLGDGSDYEIITVNVSENKQQINQFLNSLEEEVNLRMAMDSDRSVTKAYNVGPLPTTIAVDKNNKIVKKQEYQLTQEDIQDFIKALNDKGE